MNCTQHPCNDCGIVALCSNQEAAEPFTWAEFESWLFSWKPFIGATLFVLAAGIAAALI